jgi:PAS domain S-box-containing protein
MIEENSGIVNNNNEIWNAFMEGSDDIIILLDAENNIETISKSGLFFFKKSIKEIKSKPLSSLFKKSIAISEIPSDLCKSDFNPAIFSKFLWKHYHTFFNCNRIVSGKKNDPKSIILQLTESAPFNVDESHRKYSHLAKNTSDLLWAVDMDFKAQYLSPSAEKFIGYTIEELKNLHFSKIHSIESYHRIMSLINKEIKRSKKANFKPKSEYKMEVNYLHKNGKIIQAEVKGYISLNKKGEIAGISGISRDISVRKKTEDALKESEEKYRILFEQSDDAILILDNNKFVDCNQSVVQMLRYKSKNELLNAHPSELSPEYQLDGKLSYEKAEEMMQVALEKGSNHFEWLHKRADGEVFPVEVWLTAIPYKGKQIIHTAWRDITERKKAERKILESQENLNLFFNSIDIFFIITNYKGEILKVNSLFMDRLGYKAKELLGSNILKIISKPRQQEFIQTRKLILSGEMSTYSTQYITKTGELVNVEVRSKKNTWEGQPAISCAAIDYSAKEINQIIEKSPVVLFLWQPVKHWPVEFVSKNVSNLFGYTVNDFITGEIKYQNIIHKSDLSRVINEVEAHKKNNTDSFEHEPYKIVTKNGDLKWVKDITSVRRDNKGHIIYYEGIILDITELKTSEFELKESEQKFKDVVEYAGDGILLGNNKGEIIQANSSFLSMTGFKHSEIAGKHIKQLFDKDQLIEQPLRFDLLNRGKALIIEMEIIGAKNQRISVEMNSKRLDAERFITIIRDLSDRKKAEIALKENEEMLRTILDASPDSITTTDLNGNITYTSKKTLKLHKYDSIDELIGKSSLELIAREDRQLAYENMLKVLKGESIQNLEYKLCRRDGSTFPAELSPVLISDNKGQPKSFIAVTRDITARKKAEELLKKQNREFAALNKQYLAQNKALVIAKNKAEESDRLKSAFLANMSHEIRTPMNGIIGFSDMLNSKDITPELRKSYTDIISQSSHQLLRIVNDILDISRIEIGQVEYYPSNTCMNDLLQEIYSEYNVRAQSKEIKLTIKPALDDKESTIITDDSKIRQVFNNLISNAIRFTQKGEIEVGYQLKKEVMEFFVKDTGIGIPPQLHKKIFERFSQAEITISQKYGGTGLGLAIAKANIELCGGNIWLDSTPGKGTTFYFTLPYTQSRSDVNGEQNGHALINDNYSWPNKTVLIVEDEAINYKYLELIIQKTGANILYAQNGNQAMKLASMHPEINIVLMDIKLPDINGYEVTKQIKDKRKDLPIIAQTAFAMSGDPGKAIAAGCNDYISKPIDTAKLLKLMSKYI